MYVHHIVELTERRWTLLGHMLRLPADTLASRATTQYFRKTLVGGVKRESHAGAQATSVVTMVRGEYRDQATEKVR